ncbi:MAG: hypothetical protein QM762_26320 [Chryseolinea sp.]
MFYSISWQTYLTLAVSFLVAYYCITGLLLYYREIIQFIKQHRIPTTPLTPNQKESLIPDPPTEIIGPHSSSATTKLPIATVDSDEIIVAASENSNSPQSELSKLSDPGSIIVGSIADLLNELKTLISLFAEYGSPKAECASLFAACFQKYPHLKGTTYQHAISAYVCEESKDHLQFALTLDDVQQWWIESK